METIVRKTLLYKSGLGFYCINHAQGCTHGCLYPCYAFMMVRSYGRVATPGPSHLNPWYPFRGPTRRRPAA